MICAECSEPVRGDCVQSSAGPHWHVMCAPRIQGRETREFLPGPDFAWPEDLTPQDRSRAVYAEREMGRPYHEIAVDHGITRQRANQVGRRYRAPGVKAA